MGAGDVNDATMLNGVPEFELHVNEFIAAPNVPQSLHDRLIPSAAASVADSARIAPAMVRVFFMGNLRQKGLGTMQESRLKQRGPVNTAFPLPRR
jgi:hypothetical protein